MRGRQRPFALVRGIRPNVRSSASWRLSARVAAATLLGLTAMLLPAETAVAAGCGSPDPADPDVPTRGTLTFEEGKVTIDFGRDDRPQRISARFSLASCHLKSASELTVQSVAAEGGDDLTEAAIGEPQISATGDSVTVQVRIDPTKLDPGTYATQWQLSGIPIFTASFKTVITRSYADAKLPALAVLIGGVIGFLVALAGVWAAAKAAGGNWQWDAAAIIALIFGAGLAAGAAFGVFNTEYASATVWLPEPGNYFKLGVATGAAAAGGAVTGQLAKLFSAGNGSGSGGRGGDTGNGAGSDKE